MATTTDPPLFGAIRRLFGGAMIVVGAAFLIGSLVVLGGRWTWHTRSTGAVGEVVAHSSAMHAAGSVGRSPGKPSAPTRSEVVRFTDGQGVTHEFTSSPATSHPFEVGDRVAVRFIPESPADAMIDTWFRVWGFPMIFAFAGAFALGVGGIVLFANRRVH